MEEALANGSVIYTVELDNIQGDSSIVCHTDRPSCCQSEGEWYLPDGSPASRSKMFRVTRADDGTINLNRAQDSVISPTGLFCCTVPDANDVNQSVCISVG